MKCDNAKRSITTIFSVRAVPRPEAHAIAIAFAERDPAKEAQS
jgi:hypothetical protein